MDDSDLSDSALAAYMGVAPAQTHRKPSQATAPASDKSSTTGLNLDAPVTYNVEGQAPVTYASGREALASGADGGLSSYMGAGQDPRSQAFADYAARFPGWSPPADAAHLYTPVGEGEAVSPGKPGSFMVAEIRDANGNLISPRHPVTDAQAAALLKLQADKKFDPNQPKGSAQNPFAVSPGENYPLNRGEWYLPVDSSEPRQVGDAEITYNKQLALSRTPDGRQALADMQAREAKMYGTAAGEGNYALTNGAFQGQLAPVDSAVIGARTAGANLINSLTGRPSPYGAQQASDAAYVADQNRLLQERAQNPAAAEGMANLGSMATLAPLSEVGGQLLTPARQALGPVGTFLAGEAGAGGQGAGNLLLRTLSKGTAGGLQGAGAGYLSSGMSDRPLADQVATGAAFGGLLRGGGNLATAGGKAAGRAFLGASRLDPATQNLLQSATDQGINLRAGQMSSNPFIRTMDSELSKMPFTGYAKGDDAQRQAFTRAVAATIGEDANGLTPEVMSRARDRIGGVFNDVASRTSIPNSPEVTNRLIGTLDEARGVLPSGEVGPLEKQAQNIAASFGPDGVMSGETYQAITRKGAPLDRAMQSSNPNIRYYAGQLRDTLDDALEANAKPEDLAQLRTARLQWKNMRTVEDLAEKAGPDGAISPSLLKNAVRKSYGDYAYSGAGDIGNLAEIGQRFLKEPPNSGTAQRLGVRNLLTGSGLLGAGATAAEVLHNPIPAIVGGVGTAGALAAPPIAARLLNNPLTRSAFIDQATPAWQRAAGQALLPVRAAALPLGVEETNRLLALPPARPQSAQYGR